MRPTTLAPVSNCEIGDYASQLTISIRCIILSITIFSIGLQQSKIRLWILCRASHRGQNVRCLAATSHPSSTARIRKFWFATSFRQVSFGRNVRTMRRIPLPVTVTFRFPRCSSRFSRIWTCKVVVVSSSVANSPFCTPEFDDHGSIRGRGCMPDTESVKKSNRLFPEAS